MDWIIGLKHNVSMSFLRAQSRRSVSIFACLLLILVYTQDVFAVISGSQTITIDGRLFSSQTTDTPLLDPSVVMDIKIYDPAVSCILYEEKQTVDTTQNEGRFTMNVGSAVGSSKRVSGEPGNPMTAVFQNAQAIAGSCGTYTPAAGDSRYIRITVSPSTTGTVEVLSPDTIVDQVPNALVAETLQGLNSTNFVQTDSVALTQSNVANIFSSTNYPALTALLGGTSSSYVTSSSSGAKIPTVAGVPSSLAQGQIWFNSSANAFQYYSGSAVQTLGIAGSGIAALTVGNSLTANGTAGGTLNTSGTIDLIDSGVSAGSYAKVTVNSKGLVTYGSGLAESDVPQLTTAGHVLGDAITSGTISGSTTINSSGNLTTTGTLQGALVSSTYDQTRKLSIYGTGSSYAVSLTAPSMSANYSVVLPSAQGGAGTVLVNDGSGNLSWTTSTSDPSVQHNSLGSGQVWIGNSSGVASAVTPSGDIIFSIAGSATVTQLQGRAVSSTAPASAGQVLRWSGTAWTPNFVAMTDLRSTITGNSSFATSCAANQTLTYNSVGDTMSCSNIAIANSQITWGSTGANLVLAGPSSGGAGAPAFRSLTTADLPSGVATQWSNGSSSSINYTSGFVGAGTASPVASLDVYQDFTYDQATAGALNVTGYSHSNKGFSTSLAAANFTLNNGQSNTAPIVSSVIGTTNNNNVASTVNGGTFIAKSSVTYPSYINGVSGSANFYNGGTTGNVTGGRFTASVGNSSTVVSGIGLYSTVTSSGTINTGYGLYLDAVAGTSKFGVYENSGGVNYFAGNVGIGTTNPTAKLHVYGSAGVDGIRFPDGTLQTTAASGSGSGIGVGQTWSNPSRTIGTSYQNSTGKPIQVVFNVNGNNNVNQTNYSIQVSTDNSTWITICLFATANYQNVGTCNAIIPAGNYYQYVKSGSNTGDTLTYAELR